MDWKKIYQERLVTAKEALSNIQSGDSIVPAHAAAELQYLINKLLERKEELEDVRIVQGLNIGEAPYADPEYKDSFTM